MRSILVITLALLLGFTSQAQANLGGELELSSSLQKQENWDLDFGSRLQLNWRERGDNYRLDVQVTGNLPVSVEQDPVEIALDRLSVRIFGNPWDISLGKQPISWGVGNSWPGIKSPLNLYPENVWGVSMRIPTAPLAFWTINATEYQDNILYSVRKQDYWQGLRWSAMLATDRDQWMVGFDGKVDVGVELYGDVLYHIAPEQQLKLLVGTDYGLGPFIAVTEYRYNTGDSYAFQGLSYAIDEFTTASFGVDVSLQDASQLWFAGLETLLANDLTLSLGASFPQGAFDTEYGAIRHAYTQQYTAKLTYTF